MSAKTFPSSRIAPGVGRLTIKGAPAPRNSGHIGALGATARVNRPSSGLIAIDKSYQFILTKDDSAGDSANSGLANSTTPVRKMEHLSRVRTANYGISTMDTPFMNSDETETIFKDKPHFVLCGLPVGAKAVDPHLYLNETRVGNFKTSARALYIARRPFKSGKARSEPVGSPVQEDIDENDTPLVPPMPPVTPISFPGSAKTKRSTVSVNANGFLHLEGHKFHGSSANHEWEFMNPQELLMKHQKINTVSMNKRSHTADPIESKREFSGLSSTHIQALSLNAPPSSSGMVGARRFRHKSRPKSKVVKKVNYNNPYRNLKQQNKAAVTSTTSAKKHPEFDSLDSYVSFQKRQSDSHNTQHIKKHDMPKALLRVPNPCSDTFLLQMMYDLNRPKPRRSASASASGKMSDASGIRDFEEFVHTKTSGSLMKTQNNLDRFSAGKKSTKSVRSFKSETIAEETTKEDMVSKSLIV